MIPEANASAAGPCSECELVLRAFFDGELGAAVSLACEWNLGPCKGCFVEDEIEIHKMEYSRVPQWVGLLPVRLRNRKSWASISWRHSL